MKSLYGDVAASKSLSRPPSRDVTRRGASGYGGQAVAGDATAADRPQRAGASRSVSCVTTNASVRRRGRSPDLELTERASARSGSCRSTTSTIVAAVDPRLRAVRRHEARDVTRTASFTREPERQRRRERRHGGLRDVDHVHERAESSSARSFATSSVSPQRSTSSFSKCGSGSAPATAARRARRCRTP